MPELRYVLIANPGTKRCEAYRRELLAFWAARGHPPDVTIVRGADVADRDGCLDGLPGFNRPAVVRMESPGKDDDAYRSMLAAGARGDPSEPAQHWRSVELPKGMLVRPGLWYRGFCHVLAGLRRSFDARQHLAPTACPLAVAEMFDKAATCRKLEAAGIPVPKSIDPAQWSAPIPPGEFKRLLTGGPHRHFVPQGWPSTYVKLNSGSSATGIVAVRPTSRGQVGVSTVVEIGGRFFNTRRPRTLSKAALSSALQFLVGEGAIAQCGIPLAQVDGQNFDLRVVCVYGRPVATIFRVSPHPMTNLHLGGRRGDFGRCRAAVPTRDWLDALDHAADAAGRFDSAVAGVDVVFEQGTGRPFVLEVNAFGDFFPGWVDAKGRSLHAVEIEATAALG
jgi:hypothetical protein